MADRTIYVCPSDGCKYLSMEPGRCRSHPYPARAMGPTLKRLRVPDDKPPKYKSHTECRMIVVIGDWMGDESIVIGAVEMSSYDAFMEEGVWDERKAEMYALSGFSDVPKATLREVMVTAHIPYVWEFPDLKGVVGEVPE